MKCSFCKQPALYHKKNIATCSKHKSALDIIKVSENQIDTLINRSGTFNINLGPNAKQRRNYGE